MIRIKRGPFIFSRVIQEKKKKEQDSLGVLILLYPGRVTSIHDGEEHYINELTLRRLYQVDRHFPREVPVRTVGMFTGTDEESMWRYYDGGTIFKSVNKLLIYRLGPDPSGAYMLPAPRVLER